MRSTDLSLSYGSCQSWANSETSELWGVGLNGNRVMCLVQSPREAPGIVGDLIKS